MARSSKMGDRGSGQPEKLSAVELALKDVREHGVAARGKSDMIKFLESGKSLPLQAIRAKCYDCMGFYQDGKIDCGVVTCPLYPHMPYRSENERKYRR